MAIIADGGIPIDGETESVKVKTVNKVELEDPVVSALFDLTSITRDMYEQLRLLNARIEEAFDTKIDERDV